MARLLVEVFRIGNTNQFLKPKYYEKIYLLDSRLFNIF